MAIAPHYHRYSSSRIEATTREAGQAAKQKRKPYTCKELESLISTLQHACTVIRPGRSFMRNAILLVQVAKQPHHHNYSSFSGTPLRFSMVEVICSQLEWHCTDHSIGFSTTHIYLRSWGCGAWFKNNWFSLPWVHVYSLLHITVKEMVPIILAALTWSHYWRGGQVMMYCDNSAVVTINKSNKEKFVMHMLRTLQC